MRGLARVAVALSAPVLVACGIAPANKGDETATKLPPPPPESRPSPVASSEQFLIHYTARFEGMVTVSGAFDKAVSRSDYRDCLDYVSHVDDRNFGVEGAVGGHQFGVSVESVGIHGPGNYAPEPTASVGVDFDGSDERLNFTNEAKIGSTRITISADGSGSLAFSGWQNSSDEHESGVVSWTCR